jgi:hypothetical protein
VDLQLLLTGDAWAVQFAVLDASGNLVAKAVTYKPEELIKFLKQAELSYRLRTGAVQVARWPLLVIRGTIVAGICVFALWAVIRSESDRGSRAGVTSRP